MINKIIYPIRKNFAFLCLLYILYFALDIYSACINYSLLSGALVAIVGVFFIYVFSWLLVFKNRWELVFKSLFLSLGLFICFSDFYCLSTYSLTISKDIISAVKATNLNEVQEYLYSYISFKFISFCILIPLFLYVFYQFFLLKLGRFFSRSLSNIPIFFILILSLFILIFRPSVLNNISLYNLIYYPTMETIPDLRNHLKNPTIQYDKKQPQTIVLIIGESLAKKHCSLYGYEKKTNPKLEQLKEQDSLIVFENIVSPSTYTTEAFRHLMTTYEKGSKDKWYESLTLIELVKKVGYKTYWFSNQSKIGFSDSEINRFAQLCDTIYYTSDRVGGLVNKYDEELLNPLKESIRKSSEKSFYVVHLMGNHSAFYKRYPENFNYFCVADYANEQWNLTTENKYILSQYDNSIVYNDSVVTELLKLFRNQESICFYFPDHGIDVFESRNDYIGHATKNNIQSVNAAIQIPFLVYPNEIYRKQNPLQVEKLKQNIYKEYSTDSLIYTIMDLTGIKSVNGQNLLSRSLLY